MNKLINFIPVTIFTIFIVYMAIKLDEDKRNIFENKNYFEQNKLVGQSLPKFNLPSIHKGYLGLNYNDIKGRYSLINIFASWCVACKIEHPFLMSLKENKIITVYGIAWKDKPENTIKWLSDNGDPYNKVAQDYEGETVISLGITGAPETFLVDEMGIIKYHHIGPLSEKIFNQKIVPLIQK